MTWSCRPPFVVPASLLLAWWRLVGRPLAGVLEPKSLCGLIYWVAMVTPRFRATRFPAVLLDVVRPRGDTDVPTTVGLSDAVWCRGYPSLCCCRLVMSD